MPQIKLYQNLEIVNEKKLKMKIRISELHGMRMKYSNTTLFKTICCYIYIRQVYLKI